MNWIIIIIIIIIIYDRLFTVCRSVWRNHYGIRQIRILRTSTNFVRFQVLTAASMKMVVFWVVAPCSLVEVYRNFKDDCCLRHQSDESWWWRQSDPRLASWLLHLTMPHRVASRAQGSPLTPVRQEYEVYTASVCRSWINRGSATNNLAVYDVL
jgi:hypothetical protein